jgi:hypothetical protein
MVVIGHLSTWNKREIAPSNSFETVMSYSLKL